MIEIVEDEMKAAALVAAGFDPPPYVGQRWLDSNLTWLPPGHRSIVTITSLGPTVSGWQASVCRQEIDPHGTPIGEPGVGLMYVHHLINGYGQPRLDACTPLPDLHVLEISAYPSDGGGSHFHYQVHCPGVSDDCRDRKQTSSEICVFATCPYLGWVADAVRGPDGKDLPPGRYRVWVRNDPRQGLLMGVGA